MKKRDSDHSETSESSGSENTSISANSKTDDDTKTSNSDSANNNSTNSNNVSSEASAQTKNSSNYTPITTIFENNSSDSSPINDITQKIIIIYGIAALIHKIHEENSVHVNIIPSYIYLTDKFTPYIDIDKLNLDSEGQNADNFLLSHSEFNNLYPSDFLDGSMIISDNIEQRNKLDSYIFGCICLYIMTNTPLEDKTDTFVLLDSFDEEIMPKDLKFFINNCCNTIPMYRPFFGDILYIIDNNTFLQNFEGFDINKFKEYQKTVVDEVFIMPINQEFDVAKIPNVKLFQASDFDIIKNIGSGGYGSVYLATLKSDKTTTVAYKKIMKSDEFENKKRIFREIEILAYANHYAAQTLFGYVDEKTGINRETAIITLYEENGSLFDVVFEKKPPEFDFTQKFITMYGIAAAMCYLHKEGIAHRDLKPQNILMNKNLEPLVADFGLSKKQFFLKDENKMTNEKLLLQSTPGGGTPSYMAPEQLRDFSDINFSLFDAKPADVFSFAMLTYVLFAGKLPWRNELDARMQVKNGNRADIPDNFPPAIRLLIEACWRDSPKVRPTFEVILRMIGHPIFIDNLGVKIDMKRFKEYQSKVIDDSMFSETKEIDKDTISFNGIKFPQIPKEKLFTEDDFNEVKQEEQIKMNPIFNVHKVDKNSRVFNRIDINDEYLNDDSIISFYKTHIQVLLNVDHPTINPLYGVITAPSKIFVTEDAKDIYDIFPQGNLKPPSLIMPFLPKGSLLTNQAKLSMTQKFIILYGIAAGMYYLYKQGMSHLNLKPENILLNDANEPIINIDITSRPRTERENLIFFLPTFSFPYVSPEILNFQKARRVINKEKADVYSFAMIAYFIMSRIHPWDSSRGFQPILRKLLENERPVTDGIIPPPFDKLIIDCWSTNPNKRLSFKDILNRIGSESFIRSIELLDLEVFKEYQKKVVDESFIFPIQIYSIRKREDFTVDELNGNVTFGEVNLYIDKTNGKKVVYKAIPNDHNELIEKEIELLSSLNFPSLISLYGFIKPEGDQKEYAILTPYATGKDLEEALSDEKKTSLNYTQRCIILYGIAMGMYKLHSHNIAHQDLKPKNILLNDQFEPWITDFALSRFVNPKQSGQFYYISPEASKSKENSTSLTNYDEKKSDVYSFGMLAYYIMTSFQPFQDTRNSTDLMKRIEKGERPEIPNEIPKKMKKLITSCWNSNPSSRPTFLKIVETISDPSFYSTFNYKFNKKMFYNYQVKLGEPQFIKFPEDEIQKYQLSESTSSNDIFKSSHIFPPEVILTNLADKFNRPESQYRLGCMYREGKRVDKDLKKAVDYFKKASDQGHIDATIAYAHCLKRGHGCEHNEEEAFRLIQVAIDKGSIDALVILARWYLNGFPRRFRKAIELLEKADESGHPDAPALIGLLAEKKRTKKYKNEDIIELYKKSCQLGSYIGMYHMACHYYTGDGIEGNINEAIRLFLLVTNSQNYNHYQSSAVFLLNIIYEKNKEFEKAFKLAELHREKDKFIGYLLSSDFLKRGVGVAKDEELSDHYFNIAREKRFVCDQLKMAILYQNYKFDKSKEKENKNEFLKWTNIAAENGSSVAQANLCRHYLLAVRETKSENEKIQLLKKAEVYGKKSADAGNKLGIWNLSIVYKKLKQYNNESFYLEKCASLGWKRALIKLGLNYKKLNKKSEAFELFKEAYEKDSILGKFHYGRELFHGKIASKDVEGGLQMMKDAADVGCKRAIKKMIDIYKNGAEGIEIDEKVAKRYKNKLMFLPTHQKH